MAEQQEVGPADRRALLESLKRSKAEEFQELTTKDPLLAAQTIIDPIGTLSKFGLIDEGDNDLYVQVTKGTLRDVVYLREAVTARGGLMAVRQQGTATAAAAAISVRITVCVTVSWNYVSITVCADVNL